MSRSHQFPLDAHPVPVTFSKRAAGSGPHSLQESADEQLLKSDDLRLWQSIQLECRARVMLSMVQKIGN